MSTALRAGAWYTVGNILIKGVSFFSIPIFTHLLLPDEYGSYNVFMSYASVATIVFGLAIHVSLKNAKYDFNGEFEYFSSTCCLVVVLVASCAFFVLFFLRLFYVLPLSWFFIFFLCVEGFCQALSVYYNSYLSLSYRTRPYLFISLFYAVTSVVLSVLFIRAGIMGKHSDDRILGTVIPNMLIASYIFFSFRKNMRVKEFRRYCAYGLAISVPLLPHAFSQVILGQFDRMMISSMDSFYNAGIYSFAANISGILSVIAASFDTAWTTWFFGKMAGGDYACIKAHSRVYLLLFSILAAGLLFVSPEIVVLLAPEKYRDARHIVIPLVASVFLAFAYYLPSGIEYFLKKTAFISMGTVGAAVLNILLNYFFIKNFGYGAAAFTTLFCYLCYFLFHMIIAGKLMGSGKLREILDCPFILLAVCAVLAMAFVSFFFVDSPVVRWGAMLAFCGTGGMYLILEFKRIRGIWR